MANEETKNTEATQEEVKAQPVKKTKKKNDASDKLKTELAEAKDLLTRTAAEFDNYKKRTARERLGVSEYAKSDVIKQLLPIFDNIDRAGAFDSESAEYIKGIELIVKQLLELPKKLNIEILGNVGEAFDPNLHEAVMHIEDENLGENTVAQVLQKGYRLGETVIRPAMVAVAN